MATVTLPTTAVNIAVLADLHPATGRPERLHAVMAWTDHGERHYCRLTRPVRATAVERCGLLGLSPRPPQQLQLDLGDLRPSRCSSSGRTWRTWALPSIPAPLRHLTADQVAAELARRLAA